MEGHRIGWKSFERKYNTDLRFLATELAARSPHLTAETPPNEE
jgi:hypothetical protein